MRTAKTFVLLTTLIGSDTQFGQKYVDGWAFHLKTGDTRVGSMWKFWVWYSAWQNGNGTSLVLMQYVSKHEI